MKEKDGIKINPPQASPEATPRRVIIRISKATKVEELKFPADEVVLWHLEHGAVYQVFRDDKLGGAIWLTLCCDNTCIVNYDVFPDAGKDLLTGSKIVVQWLARKYHTILGMVKTDNLLCLKYARKLGFRELGIIRTSDGDKMLVAY